MPHSVCDKNTDRVLQMFYAKISSHDLDLLASRDVTAHVSIWLPGVPLCGFLLAEIFNQTSVSHSCRYIKFQRYCVTTLTLCSHVTSTATWPMDSWYAVSTISPVALLRQYWHLRTENTLWGQKIRARGIGFGPVMKVFLLSGSPTTVQN